MCLLHYQIVLGGGGEKNLLVAVVNVLDCNITVSKFEIQGHNYSYIRLVMVLNNP